MKAQHNLRVITAELHAFQPERYELRSGLTPDSPLCPYGHRYKWIGYDLELKEYVRFTKSVFKKLVTALDHEYLLNDVSTIAISKEDHSD